MGRMFFAAIFALSLGPAGVQAATLDSEAECKSISEAGVSNCRCPGLYFGSKFGPDEGAATLHLVGRSYVPEPQVSLATLYARFGAETLNKVAYRILGTHGEVAFYCPFSTHLDD
jgi:hypothetical protein